MLVAILFAINVPLSTGFASSFAPDRNGGDTPAMSCHEPASPQDRDRSAADQHLCCFTACIPLATAADVAMALALPGGDALVTTLPTHPTPRSIGVDPPPPKA